MTMWDFFHAHADGIGFLFGIAMLFVFLMWFIREMNK